MYNYVGLIDRGCRLQKKAKRKAAVTSKKAKKVKPTPPDVEVSQKITCTLLPNKNLFIVVFQINCFRMEHTGQNYRRCSPLYEISLPKQASYSEVISILSSELPDLDSQQDCQFKTCHCWRKHNIKR